MDLRLREQPPYDTPVQGCNKRTRCAMTILSCLTLACAVIACDSPPQASNFSSAVSRFEEGRYDAALAQGQSLAQSSDATTAAQGALIAAMSAYKLGRIDDAERFAMRARSSPTGEVAGGALVLLGDIRLAQHRPSDAAAFFLLAAERLPAADAARARACAAQATAAPEVRQVDRDNVAVDPTQGADAQPTIVTAKPTPPPVVVAGKTTQPIAATASSTDTALIARRSFTIRAGSYSTQSAADKRAKDLAKDLQRAKMPAARVDQIYSVKGEELFAVRIGSWPTRAAAEKVLTTLGRRDLMVGAVDSD